MISTRAFFTAVVVLLTMSWMVLRLSAPDLDRETLSRWSEVQDINTCLIDGAELLEERYVSYRTLVSQPREKWPFGWFFPGFGMGTGSLTRPQDAQPSPCKPWLSHRDPGLSALARNYVQAYNRLRPDALAVEQWLAERPADRDDRGLETLDRTFTTHLQDVRAQAVPLRQALEQPQLQVRQEQLAAIEKRLGRDQHWYTLRFMIDARQTINALDAMTAGTPLTQKQLLAMQQTLAATWTDADSAVQALPRLRSANGGPPVWSKISLAAKEWIATLERLQRHWAARADAAQLNQDLAAAQAGYDELRRRYNAAVQGQY
ncbi:DUF3829 domain-containing protein [Pseudomonas sp. SMN5]|uniref:DUF3829 domain-containing protein n=1 Tax=Pseudomonas sp. SMN5 TaxID=3390198 RepID=UPI003F85619F